MELDSSDPMKTTRIGTMLPSELKEVLMEYLRDNSYIFSWSHKDMPGIDPSMMVYKLKVDPNFRPINQKMRTFNPKRYEMIKMEVEQLLKTGLINEVLYHLARKHSVCQEK